MKELLRQHFPRAFDALKTASRRCKNFWCRLKRDNILIKTARRFLGTLELNEVDKPILAEYNCTVAAGPFKGMRYISECTTGTLSPKILGSYEAELHDIVNRIMQTNYEYVFNIGCGEGYYAVGLARAMENVTVYAFDIDTTALTNVSEMAAINGVSKRVIATDVCDLTTFNSFEKAKSVVICDIEGNEEDVLDPAVYGALRHMDLLVEIHDGPRSTRLHDLLVERFRESHKLEFVRYRDRGYDDCKSIKSLKRRKNKVMSVNEFRKRGIEWGFFTVKRQEVSLL
jgi:hypothetical protein